jgi:phospholipid/cholesterol/gamma-HCH transport system substrate-binding protein
LEAKTNYTIVGFFVLILTVGLLSAGLWLSVGFNQKVYSLYTVYLVESAAGLTEKSPVKYNGVQVGFVKKIELNKNDPRQVELTLDIEENIPITTSTTATLISQGITGVTYVGLSAGSSELTPLRAAEGEPYPVIPAKPSLFNQLDMIIKEVSDNVNKVSMQTQKIFNDKNAAYITHTLENIDKVTNIVAENSKKINASIDHTDILLANMAKVSQEFPSIIKELKTGVGHMSVASQNVSKVMVSGKNTVDQISQQTIPSVTVLINHLNTITANLEKISNEMRQNPSVVIRGTKPPQSGPGE